MPKELLFPLFWLPSSWLLLAAAAEDLRSRSIPKGICFWLFLMSLPRLIIQPAEWLISLFFALLILIPLGLLSLPLSRFLKQRALGGGDIRLLAALLPALSPSVQLMFWSLLCLLFLLEALLMKGQKRLPLAPAAAGAAFCTALLVF